MKSDYDARKAEEVGDTLPDQAGVYVPPRPVASLSEHRTMDVKAIRLAAELDPRQAMTILRMSAPRRRRRVSPVTLGSIALLLLAAAGLYLVWLGDAPLPLVSSDSRTEADGAHDTPVVERAAVPAAPAPVATAVQPAALTAEPVATATSAPTAVSPSANSRTRATTVDEASDEIPKATPATNAAPRPAAPKRAKVIRDPWLD